MTRQKAGRKVKKEAQYNVQLFVRGRALLRDSTFALEKRNPANDEYDQKVQGNEDLFNIASDLRLIIEDNAANGNPVTGKRWSSRSQFYIDNKLVKFLNVFVRLLVIVKKFEGQSQVAMPVGKDEVEVVFEVIDPSEDTSHIKGPRAFSADRSKQFMIGFLKQVTGAAGADNDNFTRDFVVSPFDRRCRVHGDRVAASDVLYHYSKSSKIFKPLDMDPSDQKLAKIRVGRGRDSKGKPIGIANVFFHPPPVLGDNYRLKVTVKSVKGKSMLLRDDGGVKCDNFQTPTIAVWKRIKIHMVVIQENASYYSIKWEQVKRAYADAFIEVEEPPPERRLKVSTREWMGYLDEFVYGPRALVLNWRRNAWNKYKSSANAARHTQDFKNNCFPQDVVYNYVIKNGDALYKIARKHGMTWQQLYQYGGLTGKSNQELLDEQKQANGRPGIGDPNLIYPGDTIVVPRLWLTPSDDVKPSSWDLLTLLAKRIIQHKLGGKVWPKIINPFEGRKLGICVLLCKPPSPTSTVLGAHIGGKIFYMAENRDVTGTFIHELGHALFLEHGVTLSVIDATKNPGAHPIHRDACIAVRYEGGGSEGPYFDQHDSEDMISCIMSYCNDYYSSSGLILFDKDNPDHFAMDDHYTNWHFCGVCLLLLRFCDPEKVLVSNNDSFRRLQYSAQAPQVAVRKGESRSPIDTPIEHIDFPNALNLKVGDPPVIVYCLYHQEALGEHFKDNQGRDLYKDLSYLSQVTTVGGWARGKWISHPRPGVADVTPQRTNDIWLSFLEAKAVGNTTIHFEIRYGPNAGDVISSNVVPVIVT